MGTEKVYHMGYGKGAPHRHGITKEYGKGTPQVTGKVHHMLIEKIYHKGKRKVRSI
jgi:hypothetical protein